MSSGDFSKINPVTLSLQVLFNPVLEFLNSLWGLGTE
jgi:hypothetical protein